jgi:prepilin-type N-terminal cleavage/methylation domain-containing protein
MQTHRRGGFTLLEVVIALALSLLLIGTLTIALDLFRQVSTVGGDDIRRGQLARSILQQMEIDLRSCTFQPPQAASSTAGGSSSTGSSAGTGSGTGTGAGTGTGSSTGSGGGTGGTTGTAAGQSTTPAVAYFSASQGLVGDVGSIVIYAARPTRDLQSLVTPGEAEAVFTSDLKSIAYFLAVRGAEGLSGAAASALAGAESSGDCVGLARLEGDRLATEFADLDADVQSMAASSKLLAPEVVSLEFRYFNGTEVKDAWDSTAEGRLPTAVEIAIGFAAGDPASGSSDAAGVYVVRHLVSLPAADPPGASAVSVP